MGIIKPRKLGQAWHVAREAEENAYRIFGGEKPERISCKAK